MRLRTVWGGPRPGGHDAGQCVCGSYVPKPGQTLISQCLLGTVEEPVEAEPVGELTLKGFSRPFTTHNVLRLKG